MRRLVIIFHLTCFWWLSSCEKADTELKTNQLGIDPVLHPDVFSKLLQTRGRYFENPMKTVDSSFSEFRLKNYPQIIDFQRGSEIKIPFVIEGLNQFFTVDSVMFNVEGAYGYWKVPFTQSTFGNRFSFEFLVPYLVREGEFCINFQAKLKPKRALPDTVDPNRFMTTPASVCFTIPPTIYCGDSLYGHNGLDNVNQKTPRLLIRKMILNEFKGPVKFIFGSGGNEDRFDVKYNNKYVVSTGALLKEGEVPNCSTPGFIITNTGRVREYIWNGYDPAISREITIYCHKGCQDETSEWSLKIKCPEPQ